MNKKVPKFKTDKELEHFLDQDLSDYIHPDSMIPASFEFESKNKVINLRVSENLLRKVKKAAQKRKMPYQKFIREILERSIR